MRGVILAGSFSAYALPSMDHRLFYRYQMKFDLSRGGLCGKIEGAARFHLHHPAIDPSQAIASIEPSFAKAAATRLVIEKEFLTCRIGDGEMRELQIIHNQPGTGSLAFSRWPNSLTEKGQLVAKASS